MPVIIKSPKSSHKSWLNKSHNLQAITYTDNKRTLYFKSVKDREKYYKTQLKRNKKYSKFVRYSVLNISIKNEINLNQ